MNMSSNTKSADYDKRTVSFNKTVTPESVIFGVMIHNSQCSDAGTYRLRAYFTHKLNPTQQGTQKFASVFIAKMDSVYNKLEIHGGRCGNIETKLCDKCDSTYNAKTGGLQVVRRSGDQLKVKCKKNITRFAPEYREGHYHAIIWTNGSDHVIKRANPKYSAPIMTQEERNCTTPNWEVSDTYTWDVNDEVVPVQLITCIMERTDGMNQKYRSLTSFTLCIIDCIFGEECGGKSCNCKDDEPCDRKTGACKNGCKNLYYGFNSDCQEHCEPGEYLTPGRTCEPCHCKDPSDCNIKLGVCGKDCKKYFSGGLGGKCKAQCKFGPTCVNGCHCGGSSTSCNKDTGACHSGICHFRYYGTNCQQVCSSNMYRDKQGTCNQDCHCASGDQCDVTTGECYDKACVSGYDFNTATKKCEKCKYGNGCMDKCNCKDNADCDKFNGSCPNGCHTRYHGPNCQSTCPPREYIAYPGSKVCVGKCSCEDWRECRVTDGMCMKGKCKWPWVGGFPKLCTHCKYGERCQHPCHCAVGSSCNYETGACLSGTCATRYFGTDCQLTCPQSKYLDNYEVKVKPLKMNITNSKNEKKYCTKNCLCLNSAMCDTRTGYCQSGGCIAGYTNNKNSSTPCKPCVYSSDHGSHLYLDDAQNKCTHPCNCMEDEECNVTSGTCGSKGCKTGWSQSSDGKCTEKCAEGTWGIKCQETCHCKVKAQCDPTNGWCGKDGCAIRWRGHESEKSNCNVTCPTGKCGNNCRKDCLCKDSSQCYVEQCHCEMGGCQGARSTCIEGCPAGKFGPKCNKTCHCLDDFVCDQVTGACPNGCHRRYHGKDCSLTCESGTFLNKTTKICTEKCNCRNDTYCRVTDGDCNGECIDGYHKPRCDVACQGSYGYKCQHACHCKNDTICDHITGECGAAGCDLRHYGQSCAETCPADQFLKNETGVLDCSGKCHCADNTYCHVQDGKCVKYGCVAGWKGPMCQEECVLTYGTLCLNRCHCQHDMPCNPENGVCANGCDIRHIGPSCNETCPFGMYGWPKCDRYCQCHVKANCHLETGDCLNTECYNPIRMGGKNCEIRCPEKTFYVNGSCLGKCHCRRHSQCNVMSGACLKAGCISGYTGATCSAPCESGTFGLSCRMKCNCKNEKYCRSTDGHCENGCEDGYEGIDCQTRVTISPITLNIAIWGSVIAVVVLVFAVLVYLAVRAKWRKKRLINKKFEEYIAKSKQSFDNRKSFGGLPPGTGINRSTTPSTKSDTVSRRSAASSNQEKLPDLLHDEKDVVEKSIKKKMSKGRNIVDVSTMSDRSDKSERSKAKSTKRNKSRDSYRASAMNDISEVTEQSQAEKKKRKKSKVYDDLSSMNDQSENTEQIKADKKKSKKSKRGDDEEK